jgi:broad specificity phosphatase PhoE
MSEGLPVVYLARHGETAWSLSGQHTGLKDLPLTERGERNARRLGERLKELSLKKVFTSSLQRARRTCELSGLAARGTTANTRDYAQTKSMRSVRIGSCSETAVPEANHRIRSEFVLNVSSSESVRFMATC